MHEKYYYFLLKSIFPRKMVFMRKLKLTYSGTPQHYNSCSASTFLILFKKFLDQPPFRKEGTGYAFYMRDYKGEVIKLLPFYMTDFFSQNCQNIWRKLKSHMKNDIYIQYPKSPSYFWPKFITIWISSHCHQILLEKFPGTLRSIFADCFWRAIF